MIFVLWGQLRALQGAPIMEGQRKKIMGRPPGRWGGNNPWAGSAKVFSFNVQLILFHSFMKGFIKRANSIWSIKRHRGQTKHGVYFVSSINYGTARCYSTSKSLLEKRLLMIFGEASAISLFSHAFSQTLIPSLQIVKMDTVLLSLYSPVVLLCIRDYIHFIHWVSEKGKWSQAYPV